MKVCYTRKKENDCYYSDPNPQPTILAINPDDQLEFATSDGDFDWLQANGYQPRLVDDIIVESWIESAKQQEANIMTSMGYIWNEETQSWKILGEDTDANE